MKRKFLVLYDYGMGGVWRYIWAESRKQIEREFPELKVLSPPPSWVKPERLAKTEKSEILDIDRRDTGFLAALLRGRQKRSR